MLAFTIIWHFSLPFRAPVRAILVLALPAVELVTLGRNPTARHPKRSRRNAYGAVNALRREGATNLCLQWLWFAWIAKSSPTQPGFGGTRQVRCGS
jgi:hypothetical protein